MSTTPTVERAPPVSPEDAHLLAASGSTSIFLLLHAFASGGAAIERLADEWSRLGRLRIALELIDCPDRRVTRAVAETVATATDGDTEVTVLVPRREHPRAWHRLLHDRTSVAIARTLAGLPHANVTFVPYQLGATLAPLGGIR